MVIAGRVGEIMRSFFIRHLALYIALCVLFAMGVGFGALATQSLSDSQRADLSDYVASVFARLTSNTGSLLGPSRSWYSLTDDVLKTAGLIWLLGLTVIGAPLVLGIVFLRGFVLGFTVGFMIDQMHFRGIILSLISVLPHNLLAVPAVLLAAGGALSFSASALKTLVGVSRESIYGKFAQTTGLAALSACLLVLAAAVELYITPVFVQLTRGLLA
ncbi:MAG: stage II sporulation protein M [Firmicutes bacterium]|nr:stage II sporulation protein M [Bacillota bacterium]